MSPQDVTYSKARSGKARIRNRARGNGEGKYESGSP